jgi:hypothetical protein
MCISLPTEERYVVICLATGIIWLATGIRRAAKRGKGASDVQTEPREYGIKRLMGEWPFFER